MVESSMTDPATSSTPKRNSKHVKQPGLPMVQQVRWNLPKPVFERLKMLAQELQLSTEDLALRFLVGGIFLVEKQREQQRLVVPVGATAADDVLRRYQAQQQEKGGLVLG